MNQNCDDINRNDSCDIGVGAQDSDQNRRLDSCEYARGDFDLDGEITGAVLLASCLDHALIMLGSCFDHGAGSWMRRARELGRLVDETSLLRGHPVL